MTPSVAELAPLPGFVSLETDHCVSGSLRHVYRHAGIEISEDMLLGLGAGVGFLYWHQKGAPPMFAGRGNVHRPGTPGFEIDIGERTGVRVERFVTSSRRKAETALFDLLREGRPVMMNVDMGLLPYFDFPDDYHFGGHVIVAAGADEEAQAVLVADRDPGLHEVGADELAAARGSKFKPFPPHNMWYSFDFTKARPPRKTELRAAIRQASTAMLEVPIRNLGVPGIRKAAQQVKAWPKKLSEAELGATCIQNFVMIDATGGTGGGIFRFMYSRFLRQASEILGSSRLESAARELWEIGDLWQVVAQTFREAFECKRRQRRIDVLGTAPEQLVTIADREEPVWTELQKTRR